MDQESFNKVKELISNGKTGEAIELLKSVKSTIDNKKEIAIISNRFFELQKKRRLNLLSENELRIESNNVNYDLLNICEAGFEEVIEKENSRRISLTNKLLLILITVGFIVFFILNYHKKSNPIPSPEENQLSNIILPVPPKKPDIEEKIQNEQSEPKTKTSKSLSKDTDPNDRFVGYNPEEYILIDNLIWMRKNLISQDENKNLCFKNNKTYCQKFGGLFTWVKANEACNKLGWRLPKDQEWESLFKHFESGYFDVTLNKYVGTNKKINFKDIIRGGKTKVDIKFGGKQLVQSGDFEELTKVGYYWSDSDSNFNNPHPYFIFDSNSSEIKRNEGTSIAISCRCVISIDNFKNFNQ